MYAKRFLTSRWKVKDAADMGVMSMFLGITLLIMGYLILMFQIQNVEIRTVKNVMQQGLLLTNLSAGVSNDTVLSDLGLDQIRYDESTGEFTIMEGFASQAEGTLLPEETFQAYRNLMEINVEKSIQSFRSTDGSARIRDVQLQKFILYNVRNGEVTIYECEKEALVCRGTTKFSEQRLETPGGDIVQVTSIYGEISFSYQDLFGLDHKNLKLKQYSAVRIQAEGE